MAAASFFVAPVVVGFLATGLAVPALAQAGAVELHVDCPTLDEETRALLEARARAELLAEALPFPPSRGDVNIRCSGAQATLAWQPSGGARTERVTALPIDRDGAVDALLGGLHDLLAGWARSQDAGVDAAIDGGADAANAPAPLPLPASTEAVPTTPAPLGPSRVAASLGLDGELWQGGVHGALGAHGGARVRLGDRWHASLLGGALVGLETSEGASVWSFRALARADYLVIPHLEIDLGLDGRIVWAHAAASPTQSGLTAGLLVGLRYIGRSGPVDIALGPTLEGLARPVAVDVGNAETLRVPSVLGGITIEASYP